MLKIDPVNFSHERSEPLATYRAKIVPYNLFAFPPSMEVSVGCNPSRPTIYLLPNHPFTEILKSDPLTISQRGEVHNSSKKPFSRYRYNLISTVYEGSTLATKVVKYILEKRPDPLISDQAC